MAEDGPYDRVLTETTVAPHNAVKAEKLTVFLGSKCLLANAELKIAERPKCFGTSYGLVGCNGCGKSTLLRLMAQRKLPVPETWDVFLLGQHIPAGEDHPVIEEVLSASARRRFLLAEAARLSAELEEVEAPGSELRSAALRQVLADLVEWQNAPREVLHILQNLGFREETEATDAADAADAAPSASSPLKQLSGGWRMKVELAKALWLKPKLLLLDEPTNHLDFHAQTWLIQQLAEYPHTTVVVSHDVAFLHEVCKDIIWMTEQRLEALPGKVVSQEDLLRMQRRKPLRFEFRVPAGEDPVSQGVSLHNVEFTYGDTDGTVAVESLRLSGRSRTVLLGPNGGGKSTFLKLCAGLLQPGRGTVDRTPGLRVGHFSQLTEDLDKMSHLTPAEFLLQQCGEELALHAGSTHASRLTASKKAKPRAEPWATAASAVCEKRLLEVARGVLSNYGLDGDLATKVPVGFLSGGQKACLKLAALSQTPAHILLLDEPTNHLDAEACRALVEALAKFPGGIVAVTHDPLLMYRLIHCNWNSSELLLCRDGCVWKQRNFSSHSLKSLQETLRLEEAEGRPSSTKTSKASKTTKATKDPKDSAQAKGQALPPWLQGTRRSERPGPRQPPQATLQSPALPPWLVRSRGERAELQEASKDRGSTQVPATEVPTPPETLAQAPVAGELPHLSARGVETTLPAPLAAPVRGPGMAEADIPETWEDLETSSASTEAPSEDSEGSVKVENVEQAVGSRSRLHKELQNLNKAVAKWQRHGETDIVQRIRCSKAAQHLRSREELFDEDRFVQSVLRRCGGFKPPS